MPSSDFQARAAAFQWLSDQIALHGDVLEWKTLERGFDLAGERVPLLSWERFERAG